MVECNMSFIAPDEFIILCDNPRMTGDDLSRIRDAGIRTAFNVIYWETVEKQPGVYDWSAPDALVERVKNAGMKSLLRCHDNAPDYFPDDWYLRSSNGALWRNHYGFGGHDRYTDLSPWCAEAMEREREFMRLCNERYRNEWVQCFAGGPHGGEVILPGMIPCYCDIHAINSFRDYAIARFGDDLEAFNRANNATFTGWGDVVPADMPNYGSMRFAPTTVEWLRESLLAHVKTEQAIFPEVWLELVERNTPFAEAFESGPRSGNWLMSELARELPGMNALLWEVNRSGGDQGALNNVKEILDHTWIGSQFCEGLHTYTERSIAAGLRGFITGPVHNFRPGGDRFEDWMLDAIRWSLERWRAARL